jgi:deoxyadenosine/deoxycytidine kinase
MIVIDGNIGAGKTTQLDLLEKKGFRVRREPLDEWPLNEFYENPSRWAFFFHMVLLKTQKPPSSSRVIYERSLYSSRYVFWEVLKEDGTVTQKEDETYEYFWNKFIWKPSLFIYLSKDPELAYKHIQNRYQDGDTGVTLEYLKKLDTKYKKLLMNIPCRVLVINANRSAEEIHEEIYKYLVENESLYRTDSRRKEVQKDSSARREVSRSPCQSMCSVS